MQGCCRYRLGVVSEETQIKADEAGSKKTASQVIGGLVAGGAMAAGVGTGATVAATDRIAGTGTAAAVGTHYVAKHYSEKKMAFLFLCECIMNLEQQASQLNHVLDQIMAMNTFDELIQDVEYYMAAPHQRESILNSMRFCSRESKNFILQVPSAMKHYRKSEALEQLANEL